MGKFMHNPDLSLIIPCYNEESTLANIVGQCLEITKTGMHIEIIIVDDCSSDNSIAVAHALAKSFHQITVLQHDFNQGKGAALRTGFLHATGKYVGIQDADMEYNPMDYLDMMKPLEQGKADVVYGSRYLRQEKRRVLYFWHTWMNRSLTFLSNMFTNLDISDMETCYKLFRREARFQVQSATPSPWVLASSKKTS